MWRLGPNSPDSSSGAVPGLRLLDEVIGTSPDEEVDLLRRGAVRVERLRRVDAGSKVASRAAKKPFGALRSKARCVSSAPVTLLTSSLRPAWSRTVCEGSSKRLYVAASSAWASASAKTAI